MPAFIPRTFDEGEGYVNDELIYGPGDNKLYRVRTDLKVPAILPAGHTMATYLASLVTAGQVSAIDGTLTTTPTAAAAAVGAVRTGSVITFAVALPTADPVNAGQLWNSSGAVRVSAGA